MRIAFEEIHNNFAYSSFIMQFKTMLDNLNKEYAQQLCLNIEKNIISEDPTYTDII